MANFIDRILNLLKWPSAFLALAFTPLLCWSLAKLVLHIIQKPTWSLIPLAAGTALFIFLWRRFLGKLAMGRWIITMEHEITHALFAFLTFHKVVSIRTSFNEGGDMQYVGEGNWLVTVAPYFFPTAALLLSLIAYLLPFPNLPWPSFLLGTALGYHIVSTYRETHSGQSDFRLLGKTFCWMFLPAANIAIVTFLIAYAHDGSDGVRTWLYDTASPIYQLVSLLQRQPSVGNL